MSNQRTASQRTAWSRVPTGIEADATTVPTAPTIAVATGTDSRIHIIAVGDAAGEAHMLCNTGGVATDAVTIALRHSNDPRQGTFPPADDPAAI